MDRLPQVDQIIRSVIQTDQLFDNHRQYVITVHANNTAVMFVASHVTLIPTSLPRWSMSLLRYLERKAKVRLNENQLLRNYLRVNSLEVLQRSVINHGKCLIFSFLSLL